MGIADQCKLYYRAARYRWVTDKMEIAFLLQHIHKGDTVMDIGAHKGGYTYWMQRAAGSTGKVIAFEPQAAGAALLRQLFQTKIKVEQVAVSDRPGTSSFYIQPQRFDVSFEASLQDKYENSIAQTIQTISLDDYCRQHHLSPSFIKIDVEGHEEKLLLGAGNVLQNERPYILMEAEVRHIGEDGLRRLFGLLEKHYRGTFFSNGTVQPISAFDPTLHQDVRHLNTPAYSNNFAFEPL